MDIYLLTWDNPRDEPNMITGLVVQAETEEAARKIAASAAAGDRGASRWLDDDVTECEEVGESYEDDPKVILTRYVDG